MTALAVVFGAVVYLLVLTAAVLFCKGITLADKQEQPESLDDHFDGIPVEVLAPAEVSRRLTRLDTFL